MRRDQVTVGATIFQTNSENALKVNRFRSTPKGVDLKSKVDQAV